MRLLSEDANESSSEMKDQELALAKGVDCMEASMEASANAETKRDKQREYVQERREKYSVPEISETPSTSDEKEEGKCIQERTLATVSEQDTQSGSEYKFNEEPLQEERKLSYERKITVLYELLSASLAAMTETSKKSKQRMGYDARYRVALRLLATWLDVKWVKVVGLVICVCSMAFRCIKCFPSAF